MESSAAVHENYTPEFLIAVERVLVHEGGYSSNRADLGGPTKFGISARAHPALDVAALTRDQAVNIYWREWWLRFGFARLPASVAAKTFDLAVNMGSVHAIECLQRALRACGRHVDEDGVLGDATAIEAGRADPAALLCAIRSEAAGHYRIVATGTHSEKEFLEGWLNRAYE